MHTTLSSRLLLSSLEALYRFLKYDRNFAPSNEDSSIFVYFESSGGYEALNKLQMNSRFEVYSLATDILDTFFGEKIQN